MAQVTELQLNGVMGGRHSFSAKTEFISVTGTCTFTIAAYVPGLTLADHRPKLDAAAYIPGFTLADNCK